MSEDGFFQSAAAARHQQQQQQQQSSADHFYRNERRSPNITPASTVLNSPDLTNEINYLHHSSQQHHMVHHPQHSIKVGRSPVNHIDGGGQDGSRDDSDVSRDASPENACGGAARFMDDVSDDIQVASQVVFDDIGDQWCKQPYKSKDENTHRINRIIRKYNNLFELNGKTKVFNLRIRRIA